MSFARVLTILLRHRMWIVGTALALALFLVLWGAVTGAEEEYEASTTFVADASANRQSQANTELARQLGLVSGSRANPTSPNYYAALVTSRPLLRRVAEETYRVERAGDTVTGTYMEVKGISASTSEAARRAAAGRLGRNMETKVDRNTGFVTLTVTADTPGLAEQVAGNALEVLKEYNRQEHRTRAADEATFLSEQLRDAQGELAAAQDSLAEFLRRNRSIGDASDLLFRRETLERQVQMREEFVLSIYRSLERLRMEQARDLPVIRVVEGAEGSAKPAPGVGLARLGGVGLVLGAVFGMLLAFAAEFFQRVSHEERPDYAELRAQVRDLFGGLLKPLRRWTRG